MFKKLPILIYLVITAVLYSCSGSDGDHLENKYDMGSITGTIKSPNGTPIPSAKVAIDINGDYFLTYTGQDGTFKLDAPVGDKQQLLIYTGDGQKFRTTTEVDVRLGQTTILSDSSTTLTQVGTLAYVNGVYDNIQVLLVEMGYNVEQLYVTQLDDLNTLQSYAGIFLNCGKSEALNENKYNNLHQYLLTGGSMYASDWAVEYLTGDGNNKSFSHGHQAQHVSDKADCVDRIGGFVDHNELCTSKIGAVETINGAQIVNTELASLIGDFYIDIEYDLGGWEYIQTLGNSFEVLIQNIDGNPLAIRQLYTTDEANNTNDPNHGNSPNEFVTICHIPPGNPDNPITITVSANALQAHLDHGDQLGPCSNNGQLLYTTFHNHVQGGLSDDIKLILQYFILNI